MSIYGPITIPIYGEPDETGERPVTGFAAGVHYNIARTALTDGLAAYLVSPEPATPAVVWAGDEVDSETGLWRDTAFLRFDDEAEARAILTAEGLLPPVEPEPAD